jgi:RNA polymerase sigma factor (sigma-70 family)
MTPPPELPHETSYGFEEREVVLRALARLGPRQRAIVVLRYWEDMSVEQTAAAVGCTRGTVTSQTHRALATLRALLGPMVNPADPR